MWILYWQGKPTYWLHGDHSYVVGKRNTDIAIEDDPSISRIHLRLAVGVGTPPNPAPVRLTDLSKYGAKIHFESGNQKKSKGEADDGTDREEIFVPTADPSASSRGGCSNTTAGTQALLFQTLVKDEDFILPPNVVEFKLLLGNHDALFVAKWEPIPVMICDLSEEYLTKVEFGMPRCGMYVAGSPEQAELFLCGPTFNPLPLTAFALCRAKPLIDAVSYLDKIRTRISPKIPPPDPHNTLVLPKPSSVWFEMLRVTVADGEPASGGAAAGGLNDPNADQNLVSSFHERLREMAKKLDSMDKSKVAELFLPRKERVALFSGMHFVCTQKVLYQEVSAYLPAAQGKVSLGPPPKASRETSMVEQLRLWGVRHGNQILLQHSDPEFLKKLSPDFLDFIEKFHFVRLEYRDLIRCLLFTERPQFAPFPNIADFGGNVSSTEAVVAFGTPARLAATAGGEAEANQRKTLRDEQQEIGGAEVGGAPGRKLQRKELGVTRFDPAAAEGVEKGRTNQSRQGAADVDREVNPEEPLILYEDLIVGPLKLPPFPCFLTRPVHQGGQGGATSGTSNTKCFRKQKLSTVQYPVEEMEIVPCPFAAHGILNKVPAIDAEDVVPSQVFIQQEEDPRLANFNQFDQQLLQRQMRTVAAKTKRTTTAAAKAPAGAWATGKAKGVLISGLDAIPTPAAPARPAPAPRREPETSALNSFDIDNLY